MEVLRYTLLVRVLVPMYRENVEKSMFFDAFDLILLVVDELVDGGYVLPELSATGARVHHQSAIAFDAVCSPMHDVLIHASSAATCRAGTSTT